MAGTIGAPLAIVSAVLYALAPFGSEKIDMPMTPEQMRRAIRDAQFRGCGKEQRS